LIKGFLLAQASQNDLREIKSYKRVTWGDNQALDYLSEIRKALDNLVINPELGKPRNDICEGIRSLSVGKHIVFYRIGITHIEVVRILHGRMDVASRFEQD
jgi:toxin ParE1/3/4